MAERIIQLGGFEYDKLIKTSELNKKEIAEEARKLWEQYGVAGLDIEVRTDRECYYTQRFDCSAYVREPYKHFTIPKELRDRLSKYLQQRIQEEVDSYYGEPLKVKNHYTRLVESQNKWFRLAWLIAVSGWIVAGILMIGG